MVKYEAERDTDWLLVLVNIKDFLAEAIQAC